MRIAAPTPTHAKPRPSPWPLCTQELQKCFDVKDVQMLQDAISKMDPTVSSQSSLPSPEAKSRVIRPRPGLVKISQSSETLSENDEDRVSLSGSSVWGCGSKMERYHPS